MQEPDEPLKPVSGWAVIQGTFIKGTNGSTLKIPDANLIGKNILISGANNGIGREAALQFAKWGANIVLLCRKDVPPHEKKPADVAEECRAASKSAGHSDADIEWWDCDMSDLSNVEAAAARWNQTGNPLDILVNNAGISPPRERTTTKDGFELLHQINFLCHVLLTLSVLPAIAKAEHPRITCTTSSMHFSGKFDISNANNGINSYPNNKLYFQVWLTELQLRMLRTPKYSHVAIHGVHPGYVHTGIWSSSQGLKARSFLEWLFNAGLGLFAITPQQGSLTITNAATCPEGSLVPESKEAPAFRGGAKYFNRTKPLEAMPHTRNAKCRREVWELVGTELKLQGRAGVDEDVKKTILREA